jgi:hypothetical protein
VIRIILSQGLSVAFSIDHALGKVPIFLARKGTVIHFDIKDYPIIEFRNMRELKDGLRKRLIALSQGEAEQ